MKIRTIGAFELFTDENKKRIGLRVVLRTGTCLCVGFFSYTTLVS